MHPSPITLTNLQAATMQGKSDPYGLIQDAALVLTEGRITWVGPRADLPAAHAVLPQKDMGGRLPIIQDSQFSGANIVVKRRPHFHRNQDSYITL